MHGTFSQTLLILVLSSVSSVYKVLLLYVFYILHIWYVYFVCFKDHRKSLSELGMSCSEFMSLVLHYAVCLSLFLNK